MKKVAILQSNYIPWKGYFDLIASVDEFILFDDMQYTRRDWRNRNQIKTPQGIKWLTVPVKVKGKYNQRIRDAEINGTEWALSHWKSLSLNYKKTPFFNDISSWLEPLYLDQKYTHISDLNYQFIKEICKYLNIVTKISNSWDYDLIEGKTDRLVNLCLQAGATEYISGPAAKKYIDEKFFEDVNLNLIWFDYCGYREYKQLWGEFSHGVTILDLLFNCGTNSINYMKHTPL